MRFAVEEILLIISVLLFIALVAGKRAYQFGVPVVILALAIGMLAGSEGVGGIYFNDPQVAQSIGIIALNFILFAGGFDTSWQSIKPILWQGISLATLGVLLTAALIGLFVWSITDFTIYEALLLGSIVSSTDSAAVFSILRSRNLALKGNLRPTLELESGSNDPMAFVLTITFIQLITGEESGLIGAIPEFFGQLAIGAALGLAFGYLGALVINKINLDYEGLYPVLLVAIMFFAFSATSFVGGNGFLAVYLSALYLGNQELIHKKQITRWFDGMAWLMQLLLFLTLGLLVFPTDLVPIMSLGIAVSAFIMVVARPLSVFVSLALVPGKPRAKTFISWVGLRGAVPIVFATYALLAGLEKSQVIFNIVFFICLTSVLIQGTTLPVIAAWLKLLLPLKLKQRTRADLELSESIKSELIQIILPPDNPAVGKKIIELEFPKTSLISIIERDNRYITPTGSTVLQANDKLFVISETRDSLQKVYDKLQVDAVAAERIN